MKRLVFIFVFLSLLLSACQSKEPWQLLDLRLLDPVDAHHPAEDITAVYTRRSATGTEIRIDLLDIAYNPAAPDDEQPPLPELLVTLNEWQVSIPPVGLAKAQKQDGETPITFTVQADRQADHITFLFPAPLPEPFSVQAATASDQTAEVSSAQHIAAQAQILLVFYNTFPSETPAQALRSWDGAHTGPYGERHGLRHLLSAAAQYHTPLLIQKLSAEQHSALDVVGGSQLWARLAAQKLLNTQTRLPQPDENPKNQPTSTGIPLPVREQLLNAAIHSAQPLVLGGDLAYSAWGNAQIAPAAFAWLHARPYIRVLTGEEFASLGAHHPMLAAHPTIESPIYNSQGQPISSSHELWAALQTSALTTPENVLKSTALAYAARLNTPNPDPKQSHLRAQYLPDLYFWLYAAQWAAAPFETIACGDLNHDQISDCVLADQHTLAILTADGARLLYAFRVSESGIHQLIGPSWQLGAGLSDRSLWNLELGPAADAKAIPGAFADSDLTWDVYSAHIEDARIVFTHPNGTRSKTYSLTQDSLQVEYRGLPPAATALGIALDPWRRFVSGWANAYQQATLNGSVFLGIRPAPIIGVQASHPVTVRAFHHDLHLLAAPENPNVDYPENFLLPFAFSVMIIENFDTPIHLLFSKP